MKESKKAGLKVSFEINTKKNKVTSYKQTKSVSYRGPIHF